MRYLRRFNESFNLENFDVEEEEIREWLGDFLDEHSLKLEIYEWISDDTKNAFNIIITHDGSLKGSIITESEFPIQPHLPFLKERLKERGLKVSYYDYGITWTLLKIGISRI